MASAGRNARPRSTTPELPRRSKARVRLIPFSLSPAPRAEKGPPRLLSLLFHGLMNAPATDAGAVGRGGGDNRNGRLR